MTCATPQNLSDGELVLRVAQHDVPAFEALYDRHSAQAFGLAMYVTGQRAAAEEVTQDAFLSLWRTASGYDPSRGSLKTWLLTVVRHRGIDWRRRATRLAREVEIDDALANCMESAERIDEQVIDLDESRQTIALLSRLPAEQRQVVELAFFKGLSQTEIADAVGIPLGTVKGRQRLALEKLHATLMKAEPEPVGAELELTA